MLELEKEIDRQIAERLAKKKGPWAKFAKDALNSSDMGEGPSTLMASLSGTTHDADVDEVIADFTLTAVKECLTPSEAAAVDKGGMIPVTDESILMPPPDATYLQLRQHLSMIPTVDFFYVIMYLIIILIVQDRR